MAKKRALISVSDKTGIVELSNAFAKHGIEIISTGGTAKLLAQAGIPVIGISDVTGFPEIMDGRVKTLHPNIHSGLLAVRSNPSHMEQLEKLNIGTIDYVVVNLYPFKQTISKPDVSLEEAIENIDIGGPSMLRAAAKNYSGVVVLVDANDYSWVIEHLDANQPIREEERFRLAAKVFRHTAAYDALIADYLTEQTGEEYPESITLTYEKAQDLRYGENPHQGAAFYREPLTTHSSIAYAKQLHGKELSYNNINDANAALSILSEFAEPAAVAVKHTNPCGVGIADSISAAFKKAYEADPVSIFGGIVALNRTVDGATAQALSEIFLEIILAPGYDPDAFEILAKKKNIRIMTVDLRSTEQVLAGKAWRDKTTLKVQGGLLIQDRDVHSLKREDVQVVTDRQPTEEEWKQMLFGWNVVKHVKSNAIVLVREDRTVGIGAGQMNRVGAAEIAIRQAGELANGAILASDAFFPMRDTVDLAAKHGITAMIQPGGSVRDQESIDAANAAGIAMVFTGVRHFKH
ncbi:bifunctional phosphoribosylaminoimidazolecarboxamide formyltransferase/IMP cyclohydrolase [Fodinisporobacter ferrooxydans]|uniref:Bifunctional purine biosynthesis protein PurH n=1 Tax=Fodinisporobacter ferrooxydans TaxID=2901836 RepID=A0ABY4CP08_9BACL|nr:bifunctional phosphoribosylaminoimidazolecarboxamide formyltransferase/IMP cyclohydrolase [Alicyclobacillaceae bacterium MYW30-H2]